MKRPAELVTALDVERALRERFAPPAWAFLAQVRNGTGWSRARAPTADAVAMSVWPSRGLELHGFEIKIDRGDVRRELKDPEKAEDFFRFCDRWWLAVSDEEVVLPGELPPTWGLLVLRGGKMVCKVEAPALEPRPLDRSQLAAIFRCVFETTVPLGDVEPRIEAARAEAAETKLNWDAGRIGDAVRLVLEHRHESTRARLDRLRQEARDTLAMLDAVAAAAGAA